MNSNDFSSMFEMTDEQFLQILRIMQERAIREAHARANPQYRPPPKAAWRTTLCVSATCNDMNTIKRMFRALVKQHHPDTGDGNVKKFNEILQAMEQAKREVK